MIDEVEVSKHISPIKDTPAMNAIISVVDDFIESATEASTNESIATNHGTLAHAAGGLRWLRDLKNKLEKLSQPVVEENGKDDL